MQVHLFLVVAEQCPEICVTGDSHILVECDLEADDSTSVSSLDGLHFMTTLLINADDPEPAIDDFKAWWSANATGSVSLKTLTTEAHQLAPSRLADIDRISRGDWSFRSSFVLFRSSSKKAYDEAKGIVVQAELRLH